MQACQNILTNNIYSTSQTPIFNPNGPWYASQVVETSSGNFTGIYNHGTWYDNMRFSTVTFSIDLAAPTVTNVTSATSDGALKVGDVAAITVTFSEAVTVTGTPQLTLETGSSDAVVNYAPAVVEERP